MIVNPNKSEILYAWTVITDGISSIRILKAAIEGKKGWQRSRSTSRDGFILIYYSLKYFLDFRPVIRILLYAIRG